MIKNYEFLNLFKESEAALRGSQVTEKVHHAIFKKIQSLTNITYIRSGRLYNLNVPIQELQSLNLPKTSYISALKNLITDKLILQLCVFDFIKETQELKIHSCYLSLPLDENISLKNLYNEVIFYSVNHIAEYIRSKPIVQKKELLQDLEYDFKSTQKPPYEKLTNILFDPTYYIVPSVFDVQPDPEIVTNIKKDLRYELIKQKVLLEVFEYGTMQNKEEELMIRYEAANEFMRNKIVSKYKTEPNLKMELDAIFLQESAYYFDPFVPKTTEYSKKIAEAIKKNILSKFNTVRFPGLLCIEVIRTLADSVYELMAKQYKDELYKQVNYYTEKLKSFINQDDGDLVMYLTQEEVEQINPKVFDFILNSNEIMNLKWNLKEGIVFVLAYKQEEIFYKIVNMLLKQNKIENWKILALKFLIEKYENHFPNLFSNKDFKDAYGKLLRKAYIDYMPWYFKLLIYFNFPWFQDYAFKIAKEKINREQLILDELNQSKWEERKMQQMQEKKEKLEKATEITQIVRIMDKVQNFFSEGELPTTNNILLELVGWEEKQLLDFLQQQNFVLFPLKEEKVILYPNNFNWKIYANRIIQAINENLNSKKNISVEKNEANLIKIRSFLESKLKSNQITDIEVDPYKKLKKAIQKEKNKEKYDEKQDLEEIEI